MRRACSSRRCWPGTVRPTAPAWRPAVALAQREDGDQGGPSGLGAGQERADVERSRARPCHPAQPAQGARTAQRAPCSASTCTPLRSSAAAIAAKSGGSRTTRSLWPASGWNGWLTTIESETELGSDAWALCRDCWHPALRRAVLPGHRGVRGGRRGLVRHPLHRALPEAALRLHRGRASLGQPGDRLCGDPRDRRVPAVPTQRLTVRSAKPVRARVVPTVLTGPPAAVTGVPIVGELADPVASN